MTESELYSWCLFRWLRKPRTRFYWNTLYPSSSLRSMTGIEGVPFVTGLRHLGAPRATRFIIVTGQDLLEDGQPQFELALDFDVNEARASYACGYVSGRYHQAFGYQEPGASPRDVMRWIVCHTPLKGDPHITKKAPPSYSEFLDVMAFSTPLRKARRRR